MGKLGHEGSDPGNIDAAQARMLMRARRGFNRLPLPIKTLKSAIFLPSCRIGSSGNAL
ncbi:hypothetical protein [Devosia sp.]|uniref:hypothetical protein n=1 Tax=Devosia sp. TaxID=1871048 RepID=UPI002AFEC8EF|nr:hypothetical protein [Devosia sp.]